MGYKLPTSVATRTQLVSVLRNLEDVLDKGIQNAIRTEEGVDFRDLPEVSSSLAELVRENELEVNTESLRKLGTWLDDLKHNAPVVRFTFASEPTNEIISRLIKWLRDLSDTSVLIRTSVQPTVAAGCIVHTPSHQYDFSLRNELLEGVPIFTKYLEEMVADTKKQAETAPAPEVAA